MRHQEHFPRFSVSPSSPLSFDMYRYDRSHCVVQRLLGGAVGARLELGPESGDPADRDPVMTEMRVVHLDDSDTEDRVVYLDGDPNLSDLRVIHADGDEVLGETGTVTLTTVSVVIPSYNEAANIGWVLDRIPHAVNEVILVDGRSTDDTIAVARRHRPDVVVIEELSPGKGVAVRAGLQAATGDFVVMLDADGSMDPREIDLFIDSLADGNEIVKGTRFVADGGSDDITRMRRFGNATFVRLANAMFDGQLTDLCYGYIGFRRDRLSALDLDAEGFEIETQIITSAMRAGLKMAEVPSFERNRRSGRSNLRPISDGMRVLVTLFGARRRWRRARKNPVAVPTLVPSQSPADGS